MDVIFEIEKNKKFKLRVGAILIHENRLLVAYDDENNYYQYLPGGKVDFGESFEECIKRELKEELDLNVNSLQEFCLYEGFFFNKYVKKDFHEISMYYLVKSNIEPWFNQEDVVFYEENRKLTFKWIEIEKLDEYNVLPKKIIDKIKKGDFKFSLISENNY
ncbi:NUDIX hydrolase [Mycoplasma sp. CSL7503-lung]|uniref:NUDIX hydrolase n=1 Tax=Mycoplasma sp. CSL7503-lung TaxID=536372 RepID=UPI0021D21C79|nr:NUDIX domain-containing protein [Mycoplasma sp. CSL7503-lung]MCU4706597.1 NUDIX domain-containing protein [Mycoplasma sp. CSL7503-lung]